MTTAIHILVHDVTVQKVIVISITFSHIVKIIIIIKTKLIKTLCNTANGYGFFNFVAIGVPALYICRKSNIGAKIMPTNEKAILAHY